MRTGHPLFFNQLYARADPVSIVGDWLAVAANTNVHTYEVSLAHSALLSSSKTANYSSPHASTDASKSLPRAFLHLATGNHLAV